MLGKQTEYSSTNVISFKNVEHESIQKIKASTDKLESLMLSIKSGEAFGVTHDFAITEIMNHLVLLSKEITE